MGIEDLVNQGKGFLDQNKDQIGEVLKSDQAEGISDGALDAAADFAKNVVPEGAGGAVDDVRANIDQAIGNE